jgi:hypothetical protein
MSVSFIPRPVIPAGDHVIDRENDAAIVSLIGMIAVPRGYQREHLSAEGSRSV